MQLLNVVVNGDATDDFGMDAAAATGMGDDPQVLDFLQALRVDQFEDDHDAEMPEQADMLMDDLYPTNCTNGGAPGLATRYKDLRVKPLFTTYNSAGEKVLSCLTVLQACYVFTKLKQDGRIGDNTFDKLLRLLHEVRNYTICSHIAFPCRHSFLPALCNHACWCAPINP